MNLNSEHWFDEQKEIEEKLLRFRNNVKALNNDALLVNYRTRLESSRKDILEKEAIFILKDEILKRMA